MRLASPVSSSRVMNTTPARRTSGRWRLIPRARRLFEDSRGYRVEILGARMARGASIALPVVAKADGRSETALCACPVLSTEADQPLRSAEVIFGSTRSSPLRTSPGVRGAQALQKSRFDGQPMRSKAPASAVG